MLTSKEICNNADNILSSFNKNGDVKQLTENLLHSKNYKFLTPKLAGDLVAKYHDRNNCVDNLTDENQMWWYKLLNKFDSPLIKSITYNNERLNNIILPHYLNAMDEVLEHASQLFEEEKEEQQKQQQQNQQGQSGSDGENDGDGQSQPKLNLGNCKPKKGKGKPDGNGEPQEQQSDGDKLSKEDLEDLINQKVKEVADKVNKEFQDAPTEVIQGGTDAGDESDVIKTKSGMQKIEAIQRKLKFNKDPLNRFIKKTINLFRNNVSAPQGYEMLGLLEADIIEELHDLYNVGLPEYFFKDIYTLEEKHSTIVDIFVDISSSMSTNTYINNRDTVYLPDLCKYLGYSFAKNNILRDVYVFDTEVFKEDIDSFLNHRFDGGGTSITNVIKHIKKHGDNPSLILTDGQDSVRDYSSNVYLLCVDEGSYKTLKQGNTPESKMFAQNNQILGFFNGQFQQ